MQGYLFFKLLISLLPESEINRRIYVPATLGSLYLDFHRYFALIFIIGLMESIIVAVSFMVSIITFLSL